MQSNNGAILSVRDLRTHFHTDAGEAKAVDGVSFEIPKGKTLALVGESGCGKSMTALSILRLVPSPPGRIVSGEIRFQDRDLVRCSEKQMRAIRGNDISMIFQEPMTSLNPVFRVGRQIGAALRLHRGMSKAEARDETIRLFRDVGIPAPELRVDDYPHQMSGGMRQRVMIAMALACDPVLLLADEPTTALDVTIQAQILDLLRRIQAERGLSILLITHDLGIVAEYADDVAIMYAGRIVEQAPVDELFANPLHPYTMGLFDSLPQLHGERQRLNAIKGTVPPATDFPRGCRFHPRCPYTPPRAREEEPPLVDQGNNHHVACWRYDEAYMAQLMAPVGIQRERDVLP